jgi:hypothetical protein
MADSSEISADLKDWLEKLMRQDLERMSGAGIQSELMEKKEALYRKISSEDSRITVESG